MMLNEAFHSLAAISHIRLQINCREKLITLRHFIHEKAKEFFGGDFVELKGIHHGIANHSNDFLRNLITSFSCENGKKESTINCFRRAFSYAALELASQNVSEKAQ